MNYNIVTTPKVPMLGENMYEPKNRENHSTGSNWVRAREKKIK